MTGARPAGAGAPYHRVCQAFVSAISSVCAAMIRSAPRSTD